MDFSVLKFFLAVSKGSKMDNCGRGCGWLELTFLIIFLHDLLVLHLVGPLGVKLTLGVLNLVQDEGDEFLDLADILAIPWKRHIRESNHSCSLQGGDLEL